MGLFLSLVSILLPSLLFLFSLSLSLANLATRGAFGHESHLSGEYIHDGRALIGYPSVERLRPRRDDSSLRRLPDSRDLTLPDRRLLFHGGGPRIERDFVSRGSRATSGDKSLNRCKILC